MPSSFVYAEQDMVPERSSCGFSRLNLHLHLLLVLHRLINEWAVRIPLLLSSVPMQLCAGICYPMTTDSTLSQEGTENTVSTTTPVAQRVILSMDAPCSLIPGLLSARLFMTTLGAIILQRQGCSCPFCSLRQGLLHQCVMASSACQASQG